MYENFKFLIPKLLLVRSSKMKKIAYFIPGNLTTRINKISNQKKWINRNKSFVLIVRKNSMNDEKNL